MIEQLLKDAIKSNNFAAAQLLAAQFGGHVKIQLLAAATDHERQRIFDSSVSILDESIHLSRVLRAHLASELQSNTGSFLYRDAALERHRWYVQA